MRRHYLLGAALLLLSQLPAHAQWQVSTTYSGTTQYDPLASTTPTHALTNYMRTYSVPMGSSTLPGFLFSGSVTHSGVPSVTEQLLLGEVRLADVTRGDAREVATYTINIEFRWIGTSPPPSVATWIFQNSSKLEKTGLPFWNDSLARNTVTIYDTTANPVTIAPLATLSSMSQFGINATGTSSLSTLTTQTVAVQGGYGRYRLAVEGYGRHRFGPTLGASSLAMGSLRVNLYSVTP
ncbi:hypothetical protein [Armatimonas rosea]|uniref:Uncharacterized protein n=1 Tax=Armatimonas rosea TaxID=685828 RepID=A0A7W9SKL9_ARMRO|nr:hypothetical protein [Armatimonas rosea]MBB6048367.1 hypothetical protein [Armatimonas rosea]